MPVRLVDERLTTVDAHRRLRDSGVAGRRQRAVVDQAAAVLILQAALDSERAHGAAGRARRAARRTPPAGTGPAAGRKPAGQEAGPMKDRTSRSRSSATPRTAWPRAVGGGARTDEPPGAPTALRGRTARTRPGAAVPAPPPGEPGVRAPARRRRRRRRGRRLIVLRSLALVGGAGIVAVQVLRPIVDRATASND